MMIHGYAIFVVKIFRYMLSEFLFSLSVWLKWEKLSCNLIIFGIEFNLKEVSFLWLSNNSKIFAILWKSQNKKSQYSKKNFKLSLFSPTREFYRIICRYLSISRFVDLLAGSARVRLTGNSIGAKLYMVNICSSFTMECLWFV